MKQGVFILLAVVALGVIGFFVLNDYIYKEKQGDTMTTTQANAQPSGMVSNGNDFKVTPISHATMILNLSGQVIYNDPTGGAEAFMGQPEASIILISDIHGDHFDPDTITAVSTERTIFVIPQAVADKLPASLPGTKVVLKNGEKTTQKGVEIEAIPMYNLPESEAAPHAKGRGNGYVVSAEGKRIYIAGDTSATPEMKALQNIDVAFVPMNLPFTMGVEEAAEGILAFKPKVVHPYHYREREGLADVNKFKELVTTKDPNIKVELLNFYPTNQ